MAISYYAKATEINPTHHLAYNNWAWLCATCPVDEIRNGHKAVELATKACELTKYRTPYCVGTLAAACAEAGDFESAIKWQEKAIELLTGEDRKQYESGFKERLTLYQSGKPYREKP